MALAGSDLRFGSPITESEEVLVSSDQVQLRPDQVHPMTPDPQISSELLRRPFTENFLPPLSCNCQDWHEQPLEEDDLVSLEKWLEQSPPADLSTPSFQPLKTASENSNESAVPKEKIIKISLQLRYQGSQILGGELNLQCIQDGEVIGEELSKMPQDGPWKIQSSDQLQQVDVTSDPNGTIQINFGQTSQPSCCLVIEVPPPSKDGTLQTVMDEDPNLLENTWKSSTPESLQQLMAIPSSSDGSKRLCLEAGNDEDILDSSSSVSEECSCTECKDRAELRGEDEEVDDLLAMLIEIDEPFISRLSSDI